MNIADWIERHAGFVPDKPALWFREKPVTYAALQAAVSETARVLVHSLGLSRGDRIAYLGLNSADQIVLTFAAARAGVMIVPLNWRLAAPEHAYILEDCGAEVLFLQQAFADHAAGIAGPIRTVGVDFRPENASALEDLRAAVSGPPVSAGAMQDPVLLCYTSGTTGRPKGAVLTQDVLFWNALNACHMHDMTAEDRVLTVLPMFHVGGLNIQTLPALYCGATVILHDRFNPVQTLAAIAADTPSLTVQVPATLEALLKQPQWMETNLSSLRAISIGSTDVPTDMMRACHDRGVPVIQVYGATETAPVAVYQRTEDSETRFGSIGHAGLHTDIRIVDRDGNDLPDGEPGEILVRGPHVVQEYWNDPEQTGNAFRHGWFHSGDVAYRDDAGWLWFRDRIKNVIISGGENIYPAEVERVLRELPGISEVAVVGREDEKWGSVPVAVLACNGTPVTLEGLTARLDGRLAKYKCPKDVVTVAALPRNAMGKVDIEAVRELAKGPS